MKQYAEPPELVSVLGGQIATRQVYSSMLHPDGCRSSHASLQGTRTHWTAENTAMHIVRSKYDLIFIDELELASGLVFCFGPHTHHALEHQKSLFWI